MTKGLKKPIIYIHYATGSRDGAKKDFMIIDIIVAILGVLLYAGLVFLLFKAYCQFFDDMTLPNFLREVGLCVALLVDVVLLYKNPILPKGVFALMAGLSVCFIACPYLSLGSWAEHWRNREERNERSKGWWIFLLIQKYLREVGVTYEITPDTLVDAHHMTLYLELYHGITIQMKRVGQCRIRDITGKWKP